MINYKPNMAQFPAFFTIVHRDRYGTPDFIYAWGCRLSACLVISSNIARGYICHATVQAAFIPLAEEIDRFLPDAWYRDRVHGCGGPRNAVFTWTNIMLADFPIIVVDDSITDPTRLSSLSKHEWDGDFKPRDFCILLNGLVRRRNLGPRYRWS